MNSSAVQHLRESMNALDQFDEQGRRTVAFAQEEARLLGHNYVGTEHLLLGLLDSCDVATTRILSAAGVTRPKVWQATIDLVGKGRRAPVGFVLLTPRARHVLEAALRYRSDHMPAEEVSATDILIGIINEPTSIALKVIGAFGVDSAQMRTFTEQIVGPQEAWHKAPAKPLVRATCPQCRALLVSALTTTMIDDGDAMVRVTYCGECGYALGTNEVGPSLEQ
jgi:ATP-dependent Clp protease ATP-binding subunit ClpA